MSMAILQSVGLGISGGVAGSLAGYSLYSGIRVFNQGLTLMERTIRLDRIDEPVSREVVRYYQGELATLFIIRSVGYILTAVGSGVLAIGAYMTIDRPELFFIGKSLAAPLGFIAMGLVMIVISLVGIFFLYELARSGQPQNRQAQPPQNQAIQQQNQPPAQPQNNNNAGNGAEGQQA